MKKILLVAGGLYLAAAAVEIFNAIKIKRQPAGFSLVPGFVWDIVTNYF